MVFRFDNYTCLAGHGMVVQIGYYRIFLSNLKRNVDCCSKSIILVTVTVCDICISTNMY